METNLLTARDYTDPEIFKREQRVIFSNSWHCCGLVEDLSKPNEFMVIEAGLTSLVVYLTEEGDYRAFHNICRHRGMRLLEGKGTLNKTLVCPYHDWTYDRVGQLKSLPKQKTEFAEIDKTCLSLKPAKAGVWRGMIWVHPNIDGGDLASFCAGLENHVAPYQVESLYESKEDIVEEEVAANWKIVVENFIDHYHLAHLHSGTLPMYDHSSAKTDFVGEHYCFWEPLSKSYLQNLEKNAPYPLLIEKDYEKIGAWVPMLFPCTGLSETESSWTLFQVIPIAVDRTKIILRTKVKNTSQLNFLKQATRSYSYWQNKIKAKSGNHDPSHPLGSADFLKEDIYVCEQLQNSLGSPYFEFGPSAKFSEMGIRGFQRAVKARLSSVDD